MLLKQAKEKSYYIWSFAGFSYALLCLVVHIGATDAPQVVEKYINISRRFF
jgi:hypothetical protein